MNLAYANESYDSFREIELCHPHNFQRLTLSKIETAESIDPIDLLKEQTRGSGNIFLFKIGVENIEYKSKRPISVNTYYDGGLFFAENENLAVWGTGNSFDEAINDLRMHIVHFYKYYGKMDEDSLMGEALRLKCLYADLFIE